MDAETVLTYVQLLVLPVALAIIAYFGKKQAAQIAAEPEADKALAQLAATLSKGAEQIIEPLQNRLQAEITQRAEAEMKLSALEQRMEEMEKRARAQDAKLRKQESQIKQQNEEIKRQKARVAELEKKEIIARERAKELEIENAAFERKIGRILDAVEDTSPLSPTKGKK